MSDFTFKPDYAIEETVQFKTMVSEFENGTEQRRRKWANPLRRWSLKFRNRNTSDLNAIKNFFTSKFGAANQFTWTNPNDSVEYVVRFVEDSFKFTLKAYGVYDVEFDLMEVR